MEWTSPHPTHLPTGEGEGEGHRGWRDVTDAALALRLGFRQIKGLAKQHADVIAAARGVGYRSVADLARRAGLCRPALETLAAADAFGSLGLDRRRALWRDPRPRPCPLAAVRANCGSRAGAGRAAHCAARRAGRGRLPHAAAVAEGAPGEAASLLPRARWLSREPPDLRTAARPAGQGGGVVVTRQRPGSANGVIFITLEDETGNANLIVWPKTFERFRRSCCNR